MLSIYSSTEHSERANLHTLSPTFRRSSPLQLTSERPGPQRQVQELTSSVHVPPFWHGPLAHWPVFERVVTTQGLRGCINPVNTKYANTITSKTKNETDTIWADKKSNLNHDATDLRFPIKHTHSNALTCLTLQVCITRCTLTQVVVNLIYTGTAVLTGITGTLVNIFKKDYSKCICEISSGQ